MEAQRTRNGSLIVMKKELRLLFKSKRRVGLLFMMPLIILIGGVVTGLTVPKDAFEPVVIQVLDESPSDVTASFKTMLSSINGTEVEEITGDYRTILDGGNYQVLVYLPANFSSLLLDGNQSTLVIAYNGNSSSYEQVAFQVLLLSNAFEDLVVQSQNPDVNFNPIDEQLIVPEKEEGEVSEDFKALVVIVPVYIILFVIVSPLSLILISVTIEREQKTLEVLFLQPVRRKDIVLGKIYYGLALVLITLVLDVIAAAASMWFFFSVTELSSDGLISTIREALLSVDWTIYTGFVAALASISVLIISLSILLSLLAKDEREANMISSMLPMLIIGMMFVLLSVPIQDFSLWLQLLLIAVPVSGVIMAIYLSALTGAVTWIGVLSIAVQVMWSALTIQLIVKLSETDSILELNYSEIFKVIRNFFVRK